MYLSTPMLLRIYKYRKEVSDSSNPTERCFFRDYSSPSDAPHFSKYGLEIDTHCWRLSAQFACVLLSISTVNRRDTELTELKIHMTSAD